MSDVAMAIAPADEPIASHVDTADVELMEPDQAFYAPVSSDAIDRLLGEYRDRRTRITQLGDLMAGSLGGVIHYFIEGNAGEERSYRSLYLDRLFNLDGAVKALDAAYWSKTLALTDVFDLMPQKRKDAWSKQLTAWKDRGYEPGKKPEEDLPPYTEEIVRPTLAGLLTARSQFFAEQVDGIFRALSRVHVTNAPEGFSRRMIVANVIGAWELTNSSMCGHINDLRRVIAKFMGREVPSWGATEAAVKIAFRSPGKWMILDGGTIRLRVYKKGTAHLEIHPEMAYRLNQVLAHLHPSAIPSQFRTKPRKQPKEWPVLSRPLPFSVITVLSGMRQVAERVGDGYPEQYRRIPNTLRFDYGVGGDAARKEAGRVLKSVGATPYGKAGIDFEFPYDPRPVIDEIVTSGCLPDQKAHQFYPTPPRVAEIVLEMANIGEADTVLEPEAGQGDLAEYLPKNRTTCVELAPLHCRVLQARGFNVIEADFLAWAEEAHAKGVRFDKVCMNPPFSEGRALAHVRAAATLVSDGGTVTAVLPASCRGTEVLAGWVHEWSAVLPNAFEGTGVSVVVMHAFPSE